MRDEVSGKIVENINHDSLYELISIDEDQVIMLEK